MVKLKVKNRHTDEVIVKEAHVISWKIYDVNDFWVLHITYFDEGIEQECSDTMRLCEASSKKWKDDLSVQWSEE